MDSNFVIAQVATAGVPEESIVCLILLCNKAFPLLILPSKIASPLMNIFGPGNTKGITKS